MLRTVVDSGRLLDNRPSEAPALVTEKRDLIEKMEDVGRDAVAATAALKRLLKLQRRQQVEIGRLRETLEDFE
jgi:hypothetical protein